MSQLWNEGLRIASQQHLHAGPAATKPATKSKGKAVTDSKKKMSAAAKKPPAKKPPARRPKASPIQSDEEMSDADIEVSVDEQETQDEPESTQESSQAAKGKKGSKRAVAIRPGPGSVKAGGVAGNPLHQKPTTFVGNLMLPCPCPT